MSGSENRLSDYMTTYPARVRDPDIGWPARRIKPTTWFDRHKGHLDNIVQVHLREDKDLFKVTCGLGLTNRLGCFSVTSWKLQLFCKSTNQTTTTTTTNKRRKGNTARLFSLNMSSPRLHVVIQASFSTRLVHQKRITLSLVSLLQTSMNAKATMAAVNTAV